MIGPFYKTTDEAPDFYKRQEIWRQNPPYKTPLPYMVKGARCTFRKDESTQSSLVAEPGFRYPDYVRVKNDLVAKSYNKFLSSISNRAAWGINFVQYPLALSMMGNRIKQLRLFAVAVKAIGAKKSLKSKRLAANRAAAVLGVSLVGRKVSVTKSAAEFFLEMHFGWEPLIKDIFASAEILCEPIKRYDAVGKATVPYAGSVDEGWYSQHKDWSGELAARHSAFVAVKNPNLWLANQLGLINPAVVFVDAVPFSFVLEWFVHLQDVIASWTDLMGLEVEDPQTTVYDKGLFEARWNGYPWTSKFTYWYVQRSTELITPSFAFKSWKVPGKVRVATALSLLVQKLHQLKS